MSDNALKAMHFRINKCLSDTFIRAVVYQDFLIIFQNIGTCKDGAQHITDKIFSAFEAGLATNIFHHEADNDRCLSELSRIIKSKIIIETVPVGRCPMRGMLNGLKTLMG